MGHRVGCFNNPSYRNLFVNRAKDLARAGVHGIHVDGPSGSWGDVVNGRDVCFCNHCRKLAVKRDADINDRQTRSLIGRYGLRRVYETAIAETRKINPAIVWSKNVHVVSWYESIFDYEFAELDPQDGIDPAAFLKLRQRTDYPDRFQIYTLRSDDVPSNQQTIALGYATGSLISVPYDVYPADGYLTKKRYYGKAFHYAPLYAMARYCSNLLNDYEGAFFDVRGGLDERWREKPAWVQQGATTENALFARARPDEPKAGVVFHLLDRSSNKTCSGMVVNLRNASIASFTDQPRFVFYSTIAYDKQAHERVEAAHSHTSGSSPPRIDLGHWYLSRSEWVITAVRRWPIGRPDAGRRWKR
jgi:hypothetical protein